MVHTQEDFMVKPETEHSTHNGNKSFYFEMLVAGFSNYNVCR